MTVIASVIRIEVEIRKDKKKQDQRHMERRRTGVWNLVQRTIAATSAVAFSAAIMFAAAISFHGVSFAEKKKEMKTEKENKKNRKAICTGVKRPNGRTLSFNR